MVSSCSCTCPASREPSRAVTRSSAAPGRLWIPRRSDPVGRGGAGRPRPPRRLARPPARPRSSPRALRSRNRPPHRRRRRLIRPPTASTRPPCERRMETPSTAWLTGSLVDHRPGGERLAPLHGQRHARAPAQHRRQGDRRLVRVDPRPGPLAGPEHRRQWGVEVECPEHPAGPHRLAVQAPRVTACRCAAARRRAKPSTGRQCPLGDQHPDRLDPVVIGGASLRRSDTFVGRPKGFRGRQNKRSISRRVCRCGVQSASPRVFRTLVSPTASPLAISSWPEAGLDRSHHYHPRRHPNPSRSRSARDDDPRPGGWVTAPVAGPGLLRRIHRRRLVAPLARPQHRAPAAPAG